MAVWCKSPLGSSQVGLLPPLLLLLLLPPHTHKARARHTEANNNNNNNKPNPTQTAPSTTRKTELEKTAPLTLHWLEKAAGNMLKLRHPTGLKPVLGTFAICKTGQNHAKPGGLTQPTVKEPVPKPKPNTQESSTSQPTKPKHSQTQRKEHPKHHSHPTGLNQLLRGHLQKRAKPCKTGGFNTASCQATSPQPQALSLIHICRCRRAI